MRESSLIAYTVICQIQNPSRAEQWVRWLEEEHIQDVLNAGAAKAELVQMLSRPHEPLQFEVRYQFATQEAYETYIKDHAPALREEGLKRFPVEDGFTYSRTVGKIIVKY